MKFQKDHPGIYIPPPLIFLSIFLIAIALQSEIFIDNNFFGSLWSKIAGAILLAISIFYFAYRSLKQFLQTGNTVITVKPATSLQTTGIYSHTRNPMYLGLTLAYIGIACFIGNWWHFILLPILLLIVQEYVIKNEERYLARKFGQEFLDYKRKVRRWI